VALVAVASGPRLATGLLWLPIILTVLVAAIVAWVVLSTYYEFEGDLLVAHSGPFSWRIPVKEISGVRESTSVRSGPALSMDRIEIAFGDGRVLLISPATRRAFSRRCAGDRHGRRRNAASPPPRLTRQGISSAPGKPPMQ
jgi:hypothetical protein